MFLEPASLYATDVVELGHVRFYINERRPVEHVHAANVENIPLSFHEAHHRKPDLIRPSRCAGREDPALRLFKKGFYYELIPIGLVKVKYQLTIDELERNQDLGQLYVLTMIWLDLIVHHDIDLSFLDRGPQPPARCGPTHPAFGATAYVRKSNSIRHCGPVYLRF